MKKEVYILKPVIKKTGTTHAYDVYTCVDFALFHKRKMVADGFNCFDELPINSRAKSKKVFDNIDLVEEVEMAKDQFLWWYNSHLEEVRFSTKCVGNKFIFSVNL